MKPTHAPDRIRPSSSRTQGGRQGERTSMPGRGSSGGRSPVVISPPERERRTYDRQVRDPQAADRGQRDAKRRMRSGRTLLLAAAAFAALCLLATQAFASKEVADYFGAFDGTGLTQFGAELNGARDVAVNSSGVGPADVGDIYVADTGSNRIQLFDKDGSFVSAWGADVVSSGGSGDQGDAAAKKYEICTVAAECQAAIASAGNGAVSGNGSLSAPQAIAVDPDTGNVYVSDAGNNRVNEYDGTGAFIRSFGWDVIVPGEAGDVAGTDEVQTITLDPGVDGQFLLKFGGSPSAPIAVAATAAQVQSALEGLGAIGAGDVSVAGAAGGPWTVHFQGNLAERDVAELSVEGEPGLGVGGSYSKGLSSPVGTTFTCASPNPATTTNYQWLTNGAPSTGAGATTNTYTTVAADAGKPLQCQVFKLNANGGSTQASQPEIVSPFPSAALPPAVGQLDAPTQGAGDAPSAGSVQYCYRGNWVPSATFTVTYQWYKNGAPIAGASGTFPSGAQSVSRVVQAADVPGVLQCLVTGTQNGLTLAGVSANAVTAGGIGSPPPPGGAGYSFPVGVSGAAAGAVATDTPGASGGMEVCEGAVACHRASPGAGAGQIGSSAAAGTLGIAVSPDGAAGSGTVYLADSANRRVDTFGLDGSSPSSFGSAAQFGPDQPRKLAVDPRGILYASNDAAGGEIERYDSANLNGGGVGFLAPITAAQADVNEQQRLALTNFTLGDTFTLTCPNGDTTDPIAYVDSSTTAANIDAALEAKCGPSFTVSGSNVTTFGGNFAHTDVPPMSCTAVVSLGSCSITTVTEGSAAAPGTLATGSPATATAGLEVDPATNALYLLRDGSTSKAVLQFGPANDPGLAAAPSAVDDTHGAATALTNLGGLGLDPASGRLYIDAIASQVSDERIYVLKDSAAPAATLDPVSGPGAHSATLSGTVDPNGFQTNYRFEYVDDAEFSANGFANAQRRPVTDANAGSGDSPVPVTQIATDLVPSTTYHVRLVATQLFAPTQAIAGPATFTTPGAAPSFHATAEVTGTDAATLRGAIDPEGQAVSDYHFNWGTTDSYGNTTTVANLPAGGAPVAVSADLADLTPATTYHYQLLATNATATTTGPDQTFTTPAAPQPPPSCPNAAIRQQQGSEALPDCRAYEIASQYPSGGIPFLINGGTFGVSEDGDGADFISSQPLPGDEVPLPEDHVGGGNAPTYGTVRGGDGWRVQGLGIAAGATSLGRAANAQRELFTTYRRPRPRRPKQQRGRLSTPARRLLHLDLPRPAHPDRHAAERAASGRGLSPGECE